MKLDMEQVGNKVAEFVNEDTEIIARKTRFVQRKSRLSGQIFLQALIFAFLERADATLTTLAQVCADLGVQISAQGLDKRITAHAVAFLEEMFARAVEKFHNQIPLPLSILQQFNGIYLTDSTIISLPDSLAQEYAGCGGNGSQASLKIQLVFELLRGNLTRITLRPGREPDQSYRDYVDLLPKGALSITDLGYFVLDALQAIHQKGAYFLSRLRIQTGLLTPDKTPFDLLARLQQGPRRPVEFSVLMGKQAKHQIPCRLIALPVPQEVADRRRQKAKKKARCQGYTLGRKTLALMDWTIFVTNVPEEMLSIPQIARLCPVRWQIELIFKLWKSHCGLRQFSGFRRERVLMELYGKMIGAVLIHFLVAPLRLVTGDRAHREISPVKVRKIFQRFARDLNRALGNPSQTQQVSTEMWSHIRRFGFKEKRRKGPNAYHALALVSALCDVKLDLDST